jgi:hypothetical protein
MDHHERDALAARLVKVKEAIRAHLHSDGPLEERAERWRALLGEFIDLHTKLDRGSDAPALPQ